MPTLLHKGDVRVTGAAVKTLKNIAKHEECRPVLEAAGAVPVLLSAAAYFANMPDQLKQLKVSIIHDNLQTSAGN